MSKNIKDFPVDIVYLWCNSNDIAWKNKKNNELKKYNKPLDKDATDECRFISNDELKYSLRSLEKFAPWINNIFIVTDNQVPVWLDTSNPKIHIVNHSEILPPEALPTFNATAIEVALTKIPNLSEYFLFANDDMFFGNFVDKNFFYDENNLPIFRFCKRRIINKKYKHLYGYMVSSAYKKISAHIGKTFPYFPHHNIDAYRKSDVDECIKTFQSEFDKTIVQKFREPECLQRAVYGYYALSKGRGSAKVVNNTFNKIRSCLTKTPLESLQISLNKTKLNKLNKYKPVLFCINDNIRTTDNDRIAMRNFMERMFPTPSSYEKKSNKVSDILVCYHKDFTKLENEILKPIQVGAALSDKDLGLLKDNTGDNISCKNNFYSELTALYWLWKNSGSDYKGLVHYRRFFDLGNGRIRWIDKIPQDYTEKYCLTQANLDYILSCNDIILPMKRVLPKYKSNYEHYKNKHVISDLDKVIDIIKNKYPEMYDTALSTMKNSKELYLYNMFITKKDIFDNYAKWLFDILSELEQNIQQDVETRNDYQKRVYGFLSERLFTIYMEYLKQKGLKFVELPVIYCETNKKRYDIFQLRTKIYSILVKFGIRNPYWLEKYGV